MARFAIKTLEFDKVKNMLASKAATFLGKQMVTGLQIESDFGKVKLLQQETAEALRILDEGKRFPFGGAYNITADVKRAELGSVLEPEELLHVLTTLQALRAMKDFVADNNEMAPALAEYANYMQQFGRLEKQIESAIDDHGEIKDSASPKLNGLRTAIQIAKNRVKDKLDSILHDPNNQKYFQDNLVTMRGDRYVIPIKQEYKMNFPGIVHDQSGTGATLFIEPLAVVNLNNDIKRYVAEEREEVERILRTLTQNVGADANGILATLEIFTKLDVICAKALLAQEQHAVRPMMVLGSSVEIHQGRHPLLNKDSVVPLDVQLGDKFTMLLITGPNTGGKTVSLKTVGLLTLMGQAGLHIPAFDRSKLALFDDVFADIGDEQSIEQSLSTFSSHMTNIVSILKSATPNSLVLMDELGAGTDPTEGAALAIAILSHLHSQGIRTMVTTHYSELKVFALSSPGVQNACCEFDVETLRPTYRLLIGVPGKSNAFAISGKLGLPEFIIENAKEHLSAQDESFEDLLSDLEQSRKTIEAEEEEIRKHKEEIKALRNALEKKQEKIENRRDEILRKANEEARAILADAKKTADETIRDFQKYSTQDASIREMEKKRAKLREKMEKASKNVQAQAPKPKKKVSAKNLHLGDAVKVLSMNLKGTVSSLPDSRGDLFVQMGILRSKVNISDLELIDEVTITAPAMSRTGTGKIKMSKSASVSTEINLIGMTVDEALAHLDKYLDDAYLAHMPSVRIVHGKGTGKLRDAVQRHLKKCKYVKTYRMGEFGEGDAGVTIAEFK